MTEHERQIMRDHHLAMRRTCLAQAAEHERMAKVYGDAVLAFESAIKKVRSMESPVATIEMTDEEISALQNYGYTLDVMNCASGIKVVYNIRQ